MTFFEQVWIWLEDIGTTIVHIDTWIRDLARLLGNMEPSSSQLQEVLGMYRFIVGDIVYLGTVSAFYFGAILVSLKVAFRVMELWKKASPFHG